MSLSCCSDAELAAPTLCQAKVGSVVQVCRIDDDSAMAYRLREMGFCEQAKVHKLSDHGSLLCMVCGTKLAVSREMASKIIVQPA